MAEISYIMQNGEQVNLKDAKGRELLTQKQIKLKAGNGISIAEDGTISAAGGNAGGKKKIVAVYSSSRTQAEVINPQDFEQGKHYKATLYLQQLQEDAANVEISVGIRQGSIGEWSSDSGVSKEEFLSSQRYHMGISSWSLDNTSFKDDGTVVMGGYEEYKITFTKEQLNQFNVEIPIVICQDFEYIYPAYGEPINQESNYLADYPEVWFYATTNYKNGSQTQPGYRAYTNGTDSTCGCIRIEFEEI